jgi:hypothetical protein|tara:strand:- start:117 stop:815 length:699 start_codon:yes stop_codon:yes gene_type:complete
MPNINIPEIRVRSLDIPEIPKWLTDASLSLPSAPPVVLEIGLPIVDIPGCVEAHETNNPKNNQIKSDDGRGVKTFCDAGIPSYNPIDFNAEDHIQTPKAPIPPYKAPEPPKDIPIQDIPKPAPAQTATVEIVEEIPPPEPEIPWQEKYLPAPEAATTTAAIALVATTSALLAKPVADILLRVIKPTIKKVVKKIASIRGKKLPVLSLSDRRVEQRDRNRAIRQLRSALKPKG